MNNVMTPFTKLSSSSGIGQDNCKNTENTSYNSSARNVSEQSNNTSHNEVNTSHSSTVPDSTEQNNNLAHREVYTGNPARASASHNSPSNYEQRNRPDRMMRNNVHHERPAVAAEQQEEMQLYTPDDIMRIMRLSKSSVYKLFKSGDFPAIKIGSILRVDKRAFERWLRAHTV